MEKILCISAHRIICIQFRGEKNNSRQVKKHEKINFDNSNICRYRCSHKKIIIIIESSHMSLPQINKVQCFWASIRSCVRACMWVCVHVCVSLFVCQGWLLLTSLISAVWLWLVLWGMPKDIWHTPVCSHTHCQAWPPLSHSPISWEQREMDWVLWSTGITQYKNMLKVCYTRHMNVCVCVYVFRMSWLLPKQLGGLCKVELQEWQEKREIYCSLESWIQFSTGLSLVYGDHVMIVKRYDLQIHVWDSRKPCHRGCCYHC